MGCDAQLAGQPYSLFIPNSLSGSTVLMPPWLTHRYTQTAFDRLY